MQQSTPGMRFENNVVDALRREFDCEVFRSHELDYDHKVDGEIRRIGQVKLRMPVQIQITRRVDHYGKLNAYVATRWLNTDIVSLYVEVCSGPSARAVAEHVVWAAHEVQSLPPYGRLPIYGLRIDDDAAFFDPNERVRELRAACGSPERLAALKPGTVYRFDDRGLWIMDEEFTPYYAHFIDVFNSGFRKRLRDGELQQPVRFLPVGPNRATDVRYDRPKRRAKHRFKRRA